MDRCGPVTGLVLCAVPGNKWSQKTKKKKTICVRLSSDLGPLLHAHSLLYIGLLRFLQVFTANYAIYISTFALIQQHPFVYHTTGIQLRLRTPHMSLTRARSNRLRTQRYCTPPCAFAPGIQ